MPNDACNPKNVAGKLAGTLDVGGVRVEDAAFAKLTGNAKLLANQQRSTALKAALPKDIADETDDVLETIAQNWYNEGRVTIGGVVRESMRPSLLFPKEIHEPVLDFVDSFYVSKGGDFKPEDFREYKAGIKDVFNGLDMSLVKESDIGELRHWKNDLLEGYPFWQKSPPMWQRGLNNMVGNAINLSGNVIMGNPLELLVKGPTLYGFTPSIQGLGEALIATKGNLWGKIPALSERGVYGTPLRPSGNFFKIPGTGKLNDLSKKTIEFAMNTTQRPLLNISYSIGKLKGGEKGGLEAVERIAFQNRLGNKARAFRDQGSSGSLKLMQYTFGQYNMLGELMAGLNQEGKRLNSARALATYGGLMTALGGGASFVPAPLAAVFQGVDGFKDWQDEHSTVFTKLLQPGNITVGAAQSIFTSEIGQAQKDFASGTERLSNGDFLGGLGDYAMSGLAGAGFFGQNMFTNPRVRRTAGVYVDLLQKDLDEQEGAEKLNKTWNPLFKK